jgi:hypothetical protein
VVSDIHTDHVVNLEWVARLGDGDYRCAPLVRMHIYAAELERARPSTEMGGVGGESSAITYFRSVETLPGKGLHRVGWGENGDEGCFSNDVHQHIQWIS